MRYRGCRGGRGGRGGRRCCGVWCGTLRARWAGVARRRVRCSADRGRGHRRHVDPNGSGRPDRRHSECVGTVHDEAGRGSMVQPELGHLPTGLPRTEDDRRRGHPDAYERCASHRRSVPSTRLGVMTAPHHGAQQAVAGATPERTVSEETQQIGPRVRRRRAPPGPRTPAQCVRRAVQRLLRGSTVTLIVPVRRLHSLDPPRSQEIRHDRQSRSPSPTGHAERARK